MQTAFVTKKIIIPAVTPYFLDKGEDWLSEHAERIVASRKRLRWWRAHTMLLEEGAVLTPSAFVASLVEMGYVRADRVALPGEFSGGGAYWLVWPIARRGVLQVEFFGNRIERLSFRMQMQGQTPKVALPKSEFGELSRLKPGDYVVHADHGIGIFRGIDGEGADRVFMIEYAPPRDGHMPDTLRVPLAQAKKLTPYYGFETPKIHRLGSQAWLATRRRVREDVLKIARELLALYAERHTATRPPWRLHADEDRMLGESFPYTPTEDQERALRDIDRDLLSRKPMDRLLIGDVGFGKTEVALRAAWKIVVNGSQVAVLAPTTVLADQHYRTFRERLEPLGCRVAMLSRLTGVREMAATLAGIKSGMIDVVIGTHRILSGDVSFKRLGLLIVDEEQRFGVLEKEKLKMLRATLDTLSLSATPIPRTMFMTLAKLRPISELKTAPQGRISIKTFVVPYSTKIIRDAIDQELRRGGQVYFLHNRIETIEMRRAELERLFSEVSPLKSVVKPKFAIIHGRLPEKELVETMEKFRKGEFDVLVATTIIENGLDLSNVNTLIVADSVRLGLGQAHQLRGRVGRGSQQAYAYFLYSPRHLTDIAAERLAALQESDALGAGFEIAMKDLELRGAGNILGKQQSGAMNAVGLNLYMQMLAETVEGLRENENRQGADWLAAR